MLIQMLIVRDKLGLAFDIYDINSNGQVRESKGHFIFHLRLCKYIQ